MPHYPSHKGVCEVHVHFSYKVRRLVPALTVDIILMTSKSRQDSQATCTAGIWYTQSVVHSPQPPGQCMFDADHVNQHQS